MCSVLGEVVKRDAMRWSKVEMIEADYIAISPLSPSPLAEYVCSVCV